MHIERGQTVQCRGWGLGTLRLEGNMEAICRAMFEGSRLEWSSLSTWEPKPHTVGGHCCSQLWLLEQLLEGCSSWRGLQERLVGPQTKYHQLRYQCAQSHTALIQSEGCSVGDSLLGEGCLGLPQAGVVPPGVHTVLDRPQLVLLYSVRSSE